MIHDPVIMLHNVVMSLSDALDLVHDVVVDHQQRVAYAALRFAQALGLDHIAQADLLYAAVLHDIGILSVEEKIDMMKYDVADGETHAMFGATLLRSFPLFQPAAALVRWHHQPWHDEAGWEGAETGVRRMANVINLADRIDVSIDKKHNVLGQIKSIQQRIRGGSGSVFAPELVECFLDVSRSEAFWLDMTSPRIYTVLAELNVSPLVPLNLDELERVGGIFSRVVDFRSQFTATHSAGVAITAQKLAERLHFERRECRLMRIAGYLHDLGKVAVPNSILEKPGKLDAAETDVMRGHTYYTFQILDTIGGFEDIRYWAAYHHERMDGRGYPFRMRGEDLSLGARIMAVADVFTAITEDRPYRAGMNRERCLSIMKDMVESGGLDGYIVDTLSEDFDVINECRQEQQKGHLAEYRALCDLANRKTS